ncbi:MAG: ATP-binding protein [Tissierellales bacterium]|jgi:signal transduction histidine kinase|nr:ATP-binding protein [Tissierellales bacterium]MBN2827939.1 ATP-binding protein [Tissierellales bacterium]
MDKESKKIEGIVNELISNSLNAEASDITVHIKKENDETIITVKDNGIGMDEETQKKIYDYLNQPNIDDLEDYYGELAGNIRAGSGLNIVGFLVDKAIVESSPGEGTTIIVHRKEK